MLDFLINNVKKLSTDGLVELDRKFEGSIICSEVEELI
jgi:hypothetical protein